MKYVFGIGNNSPKYEGTRHNIGFEIVDELANSAAHKWIDNKNDNLKSVRLDDNSMLLKSMLYVNNTGATASTIALSNQAPPHDFLFVCDDANLDFGKMRLRSSGSAGGHHGLESVIQELHSDNFSRLRIGIRTENMPNDLPDFVLAKFSPNENEKLKVVIKNAAEVCRAWLFKGFEAAQNRLSQLQSVKQENNE